MPYAFIFSWMAFSFIFVLSICWRRFLLRKMSLSCFLLLTKDLFTWLHATLAITPIMNTLMSPLKRMRNQIKNLTLTQLQIFLEKMSNMVCYHVLVFSCLEIILNCFVFIEITIKLKLGYTLIVSKINMFNFRHTLACNLTLAFFKKIKQAIPCFCNNFTE